MSLEKKDRDFFEEELRRLNECHHFLVSKNTVADLSCLAYSFPREEIIDGGFLRKYELEVSDGRAFVGVIESYVSNQKEDPRSHAVCVVSGLEPMIMVSSDLKNGDFYLGFNELGSLHFDNSDNWNLCDTYGGKVGGFSNKGILQHVDSLRFSTSSKSGIFPVGRRDRFQDFFKCIFLISFFTKSKENYDLVIPIGMNDISEPRRELLFCASIFFRTMIFPFDFSYKS